MQTSHRDDTLPAAPGHHHAPPGARLLAWVLPSAAFVIAGFAARAIYPDNPMIADLAAAVGALMLAAPILANAVRDLWHGHAHMDELVALAVLASMAQGDFHTVGVISFFMLMSVVVESRTAAGAHAAIESLVRLTPVTARRIGPDGAETDAPAAGLQPGDRLRIRPGDQVPADARIIEGRTTLNEATVTGESLPAEKGPGEEIFAGTQNLTGALVVEVTRAGEDTTLGRVRQLILAAGRTRLPFTRMIDRYVGYYTPLVLVIAALVWFFTGSWDRVVAVLVVSCPCALILATPTAMVAALSAAARMGILVKHVADLESCSRMTAFLFDKTGTLTHGRLAVERLTPAEGVPPSELLAAAAAAERFSHHPVARALNRLAEETGLTLPEPRDVHEEPGRGLRARVDGAPVWVGRAAWIREHGGLAPDEAAESTDPGMSLVHVARDGRYLGRIGLRDEVRPEAAASIAELPALGIRRMAMFTGDRASVAQAVAERVGLPEVRAECLPQGKVDFVQDIRAQGYRVAVVGDGVNDAPALAAGDISIAMGAAGSDAAIHSATIALMNSDLRRIPFLLRLSRRTRAVTVQNMAIGLGFIVGGLILGGAGRIHPIAAALLHNVGSLIVIFNSGRLVRAPDAGA
jgi:Zn2+/Cd2+-exporting ATPase